MRVNGEIPEDPKLHLALVVYASDRTLLDTAWRPHADRGESAGPASTTACGSTNRPALMNGCSTPCSVPPPAVLGGWPLALYDSAGQRIVSVAQEGVAPAQFVMPSLILAARLVQRAA